MIKFFLTSIFLIMFSSKSFASIDGKSLYCKMKFDPEKIKFTHELHSAYAFSDGKYVNILFNFKNDKYDYGINYQHSYNSYLNYIELYTSDYVSFQKIGTQATARRINRKTMQATDSNKKIISNCEPYNNFKSLKKKLDTIKLELQTTYNQKLTKNKF
jgi:hypothetical protein